MFEKKNHPTVIRKAHVLKLLSNTIRPLLFVKDIFPKAELSSVTLTYINIYA